MPTSPMEPSRRTALLHLKLATLVREHIGRDVAPAPGTFTRGAAALVDDVAWVLVEDLPERGLGPALAWALRNGARSLEVLAESGTGTLRRRADHCALPVQVWHIADRALIPAIAEPLPMSPPASERHRALLDLILEGGAEPVVEFGVLSGEVDGLEVCRVVDDPVTGQARLEVGVGAHDREAFQLLHGDRPTVVALADVVETVRSQRADPIRSHPLSRLAPERALRRRLVAEPSVLVVDGQPAQEVSFAPPPVPRPNLKDPSPAVALATVGDEQVTVVCSVGVDLDVVPYACDARAALGTDTAIVVVPRRDAVEIQHAIGAAMRPPVRVVGVD